MSQDYVIYRPCLIKQVCTLTDVRTFNKKNQNIKGEGLYRLEYKTV